MANPVVGLNRVLEVEHHRVIADKRLVFKINRNGKVACTTREGGWCGIGRSPRQALDDWLDKLTGSGKGNE